MESLVLWRNRLFGTIPKEICQSNVNLVRPFRESLRRNHPSTTWSIKFIKKDKFDLLFLRDLIREAIQQYINLHARKLPLTIAKLNCDI